VPRRLTVLGGRRPLAALAAAAAVVAPVTLIEPGPAVSAKPTVTISGHAYAFNHSETALPGATIRVRELPGAAAITDANGDYVLTVPDEADVTPYIEPPPGYNEIDLQTFHTRGRAIKNANFQTPADAEYNALAQLLAVPTGPDGRPEQCAIVTTASKRDVRGVDFETLVARTPHGVPGATAHAKPSLPGPIYFNDSVIPDPSQPETSGDGGIIWPEVPTGTYRVDTQSPSTRFATFLATCAPGRIVNANPPWGAYELTPGERALSSGIVAGSIKRVRAVRREGRRLVSIRVEAAERLELRAGLRQDGRLVAKRRRAKLAVGFGSVRIPVPASARRGRSRITIHLSDAVGESVPERLRLRLPAEP
jgi:hypothetical protein